MVALPAACSPISKAMFPRTLAAVILALSPRVPLWSSLGRKVFLPHTASRHCSPKGGTPKGGP